jgi:broad specificity phosphatase PhoE
LQILASDSYAQHNRAAAVFGRRNSRTTAGEGTFVSIACVRLAAVVWVALSSQAVSAAGVSVASTVSAMREGGVILVFRHTATDPEREQELSEQGEKQAHGVGTFLHDLHVPTGAAYSSKAKRALDMARLAGLENVTPLDALTEDSTPSPTTQAALRADEFRQLLRHAPRKGSNVVVIADQAAIAGAIGADAASVQEGELVVVRPDPQAADGFRIVGRLTLRDLRDHWRETLGKAK